MPDTRPDDAGVRRMTLRAWQQHVVPEREILASRIKKVHSFLWEMGDFTEVDELPDRDALIICHKNDGGAKYESWIFDELAGKPEHRYVLAMVNSDGPFRFAGPLGANVLGVFTGNRVSEAPGVHSLPLGIQDDKVPDLCRVRSRNLGVDRPTLAYLNFTYNETPHYNKADKLSRAAVIRHFEGRTWAKCAIRSVRQETPAEQLAYYDQLARAKFCVSPEGNGIDTYRTWEALYLGAIPIVMDSVHMRSFAELPIVYTRDYEEITRPMLEECHEEFLDREFDFSSVLNSTYAERVQALVATLDHPGFCLYSPEFLAQWGKYYR